MKFNGDSLFYDSLYFHIDMESLLINTYNGVVV